MTNKKEPFIFILSWNRPIYLWVCLDSIYRHTQHECKIVLADNHSEDPMVENVINGFERRGMFHAVHRCEENSPFRFKQIIEEYWSQIGDYFVFVEGDIEILPVVPCWLTKFVDYMESDPKLGSVGSRVYQPDFVSTEKAKELMPEISEKSLANLIKAVAPMRHYEETKVPLINPHNPPLRLMMMRKSVYEKVGFGRDYEIHERVINAGYKSMISSEITHRHLSLLNIFDYYDYSDVKRDDFFSKQLRKK